MGTMIFNGISTVDMGVVIQSPPVYGFPDKDYEITHVEGKSGDIVINKGSYQNVKRTYNLASVFRANTSFILNASAITSWLTSADGYAKLEDSYEPDHYRLALFRSSGEMTNYYDQATVIQVNFECKPQRYLKIGDEPINITGLGTYVRIINPTKFIALPEIIVDGVLLTFEFYSGNTHTINDKTSSMAITFTGIGTIDSELQDCYKTSGYVNNLVSLVGGFPKLYPGTNWVKVTGTTLNSVVIKPKWWTL